MKNGRPTEVNATAELDSGIVAHPTLTADLFDDAPVPLGDWPNPETLEGRFLARLIPGGEMTSGDWLRDAHSMRLAAEVKQLRDLGWSVRAKLIDVRTNDRGRHARVARYSLDPRQAKAAAASERGQRYLAAVDAAEGRNAK